MRISDWSSDVCSSDLYIALWCRDRAFESHAIVGVRDKTEICGDVFDLGTVLEFLATRKSVADSFLVQSLFDEIECMTCSNENSYLLARTAGSDIFGDLVDDPHGFFIGGLECEVGYVCIFVLVGVI